MTSSINRWICWATLSTQVKMDDLGWPCELDVSKLVTNSGQYFVSQTDYIINRTIALSWVNHCYAQAQHSTSITLSRGRLFLCIPSYSFSRKPPVKVPDRAQKGISTSTIAGIQQTPFHLKYNFVGAVSFSKYAGTQCCNHRKQQGRSVAIIANNQGRSIVIIVSKQGRTITIIANNQGRSIAIHSSNQWRSITIIVSKQGRNIVIIANKQWRSLQSSHSNKEAIL